jgi:hypothetical protein
LVVAVLLDFHYLAFNGDAAARMANGFYVLYSRDPHLAAVGFVWNPGMSIADMVPLLFYHLWTPLATHMFAASLVSAACMAGVVHQVRCTLAEWGVARTPRLILVAFLALNAMVVYYGGNGMSEGLYLITLVATARYLLRWLRQDDLGSLVYAAISLGLCYLARNEAVAPAILAGPVVLAVGYLRHRPPRSSRVWAGLTDLVIFEIPFATAFVGWAVVSYVITGQPFQQFTSVYGTASQLQVLGRQAKPQFLHDKILHDVHDVFYLAPTIPIVIIVAVYLASRRRDIGLLAPLTVVGGALGFDLLAYIGGSIAQWFRYFITAIPLEVLLVGSFFATAPALVSLGSARRSGPSRSRIRRRVSGTMSILIVLVLLVPSAVTTVLGMANPSVGYEETQDFLGYTLLRHPTLAEKANKDTYPDTLALSDYLSGMRLIDGQVLVDNFSICVPQVITMSVNPDIFVIPNDRDFQRILSDPLTFHDHYILDPDPSGVGSLATTNTSYPNLWKTGAGFTTQVHDFPAAGQCPEFRLFRVTGHPGQVSR